MYELTFLVNPNISSGELTSLLKQLKDFILRYDGEIIKDFSSQKINLAYAVKKLRQAYLIVIDFDLEKNKIEALKNYIKDSKSILRHLLITKKPIKIQAIRIKPIKPRVETKAKTKVKIEELDKRLEEILEE